MAENSDLAILFLHALPLDERMWEKQMSLLPGQTYAPNLYELGDNVEVWARKCIEKIQFKRLIVVGCSVGGSCALEVARLIEDRVDALVLIGTKARRDPNPGFFQESVKYVRAHGVSAAWYKYWAQLFNDLPDKDAEPLAREIALDQTSENLLNGISAFHTRPSRDDFVRKTEIPIHIITGSQDSLPGLAYTKEMANDAKNAKLHIVKSSGHYVPMVQPAALNEILEAIIEPIIKSEHRKWSGH